MAAELAQRVVVLSKAAHHWPVNYFTHLVGFRMPAFVEGKTVMAGLLVVVSGNAETVTLTFEGLQPEDPAEAAISTLLAVGPAGPDPTFPVTSQR